MPKPLNDAEESQPKESLSKSLWHVQRVWVIFIVYSTIFYQLLLEYHWLLLKIQQHKHIISEKIAILSALL